MATEQFTYRATAGQTVYLSFYDPAEDKFFDFDDDTWQASPTTKYATMTEKTALGDTVTSLYVAAVDLSDLHSSDDPLAIVVTVWQDATPDSVLDDMDILIAAGQLQPIMPKVG